jgi:predicted nucleotidyltransferase
LRKSIKKQLLNKIIYDNESFETAAGLVGVDINTVKKILVRHNIKKLKNNQKLSQISHFKAIKNDESTVQIYTDEFQITDFQINMKLFFQSQK